MFILDDILLFPLRGMYWIAREIHNAAQQELATEADAITAELRELYMMLETGRITEFAFEAREKELLDRLDKIEERTPRIEAEDEEAEEQENIEGAERKHREAVNA